jgi:ubiquinone/menaquinone biosynthesis C-methylase UbiE
MIDALHVDPARLARAYSRRSRLYARTVAKWERRQHEAALDLAAVRTGERVLEVAVGPGLTLVDLARAAGPGTPVTGVDLSPGMLDVARDNLRTAGIKDVDLRLADAADLPFPDGGFDVLYNAYMLDLVPTERIPTILAEFHRVLAPHGRLVLLNMSKPDATSTTLRERLYRHLPEPLVLNVLGGCRPVVTAGLVSAAGFTDVERTYLPHGMASEVVTARRPAVTT